MTVQTSCPACNKTLNLPDGAVGKRVRCSGCDSVCRILESADGGIELEPVEVATPAPETPASVECPECGESVASGESFCGACGASITDETKEKIAHEEARQERMAAGRERRIKRHEKHRERKMASAGKVLIALSVMFAVFGTIFGFMTKKQADEALSNLAGYEPDEILTFEGESRSAAEWTDMINAETTAVFATNYVLAVIMLAIYFWSRRSPLPALLTGFGIFIAVHVYNAALDPRTIGKGVILKVIFIMMFIAGIKAALAQRAIDDGRADADPGLTRRKGRSRRSASA